ncbi:MAG: ABC transporter substrate-binding protein [Inhella sp.]
MQRRQLLTALAAISSAAQAAPLLRIGASAALTGPAAALGRQYHLGSQAALQAANDQGGIQGQPLALDLLDDGYEPDRAVANTEALVGDERVLALLGYVGTPTSMAALPLVKRHQLAFVGPYSGADALWERANPQVYMVRASYRDEARALAHAIRADGARRVNVFYQADLYGRAGLEALRDAVTAAGIALGAADTVKRNTVEVSAAVNTLTANAEAIYMVSTYETCAAFVAQARKAGYRGRFYSLSFAGREPLRAALGGSLQGLVFAQVVPDPEDAQLPVVAQYQRALRAMGASAFDSISLEGYLATRVLLEALRRVHGPMTRAGVLQALAGLGRLDLGGYTVQYGASERRGSRLVRIVRD